MKIPYSRQWIDQSDIEVVTNILKSDFLTQGPTIEKFEKEIKDYVGSSYCITLNSATSALHLSCLALGLKKGDLFWTSPISFVASANCGLYCGANVDFVDINKETFNIDINCLEEKLYKANSLGKLPKVIIPVHMAGHSSNAKEIYELVKPFNIKILEDASHSFGGKYNNKLVGSCNYSDVTVFSFHPVKIFTSGEGGAMVTNNEAIYKKVKNLRSHGINRDKKYFENKNSGIWHYEQVDLGWNYRLTDIQAGLGISQLKKVDKFVKKRNKLAYNYGELLKDLPLILPKVSINIVSSFHLYIIKLLNPKKHKMLFSFLREKGIYVNLHYIPIHLHPYYQKLGFRKGMFPQSEDYYSRAISIPLYPLLKEEEQVYVCNTIKEGIKL